MRWSQVSRSGSGCDPSRKSPATALGGGIWHDIYSQESNPFLELMNLNFNQNPNDVSREMLKFLFDVVF